MILSEIEQRIKSKIESIGTPLRDWDISIYRGVLTGYNDAFIIDGETKNALIKADPKSGEIIRPILRGRDIKRYSYQFADLYLIATFPSKRYDIDRYPAIKEHLLGFGYDRLNQTGENGARKKTNNKWFETQDSIGYWEDFFQQKLVWAETMRIHKNSTDRFPRFGFDLSGTFITDKTCFFAVGRDIKHILGILNSTLGRYLCSKYVSVLDDGGYLMQKIYLENIPIAPKESKLEGLVNTLLRREFGREPIEEEIDDLIYQAYQLSTREISFIKEFLTQ